MHWILGALRFFNAELEISCIVIKLIKNVVIFN